MLDIGHTAARLCALLALIAGVALAPTADTDACTTIMVGQQATEDGSVLMASSCDGDVMGLVYVLPGMQYTPGTELPMYWNVPRPKTYEQYQANLQRGYDVVGSLPTERLHRSIIMAGNVESMTTGGLNEHGLSIAIEFLPMRSGLACDKGVVGPNSNHWTTSLIANGLLRATTAREAIRIIGSMVEKYGFLYYRAPHAGVALPIADGNEVWLMEIFGPGENWTPDSGRPGGVWCAQRVPDGEVGCSANRSRIGHVNIQDNDHFLASSNIFALATSLKLWNPSEPFVWREVYGGPGDQYNSLREWRALSLAAPSLGLKATGDPDKDRYPFSVKPDQPVAVHQLMDTMRDSFEGTHLDITDAQAFQVEGRKSPLARPWGAPELLELLDVKPKRSICTPTSGYVFVTQLRDNLPAAFGNCMWFAYGPANTSCFTPIYAGITDLPDTWATAADFTRIDREQPQWNFRLVHNLTSSLRYQDAIRDVQQVIRPAETRLLEQQLAFEKAAARVLKQHGPQRLTEFLNDYTASCANQVAHAYDELVDYLTFKYLVGSPELATQTLPHIVTPDVAR